MSSKNRGARSAGLRKTILCPECGTFMKKVTTKSHQHHRDEDTGKIIQVSRVFYGCPKSECGTIVWLNYREDGKRGRLNRILEIQKKFGIGPIGLSGPIKGL